MEPCGRKGKSMSERMNYLRICQTKQIPSQNMPPARIIKIVDFGDWIEDFGGKDILGTREFPTWTLRTGLRPGLRTGLRTMD